MTWSLAVWSWPHRGSWMVKNLARQIDSLCVIFFVNFLLWHYSTGARSVSTFHRALMPSTASRGAPRLRAWSRHACSCRAPRRFAPTSFSIIMAYIQPMQHQCSAPTFDGGRLTSSPARQTQGMRCTAQMKARVQHDECTKRMTWLTLNNKFNNG